MRAQHGEAVDQLIELEQAIEVAGGATETARAEIRDDVGVQDPHEFDRLAAPYEAKAGPIPWLRKDGNTTKVVDMNTRTLREPSPEELADGAYFQNLAEFKTSNVDWSNNNHQREGN